MQWQVKLHDLHSGMHRKKNNKFAERVVKMESGQEEPKVFKFLWDIRNLRRGATFFSSNSFCSRFDEPKEIGVQILNF